MSNINSEIWEEYLKLMVSKDGITKEAYLNADDSGKLYNIMTEDRDILDKAHAESCYILPAYDRYNGLVENLKERGEMMHYIATKPTDGKLTNKRYVKTEREKVEARAQAASRELAKASEQLVNGLVSCGFSMDARNEEELALRADRCLGLVKIAPAPAIGAGAIVGIVGAGVAAAVGIIALLNSSFSDNMKIDLDQAEKAMNEMFEEMGVTTDWWEDFSENTSVKDELEPTYKIIELLKLTGEKVNSIKMTSQISEDDLERIKDMGAIDLSSLSPEEAQKKKVELASTKASFEKARSSILKLYQQHGLKILSMYERLCQYAVKKIPEQINLIKAKRDSLGVAGAWTKYLSYVVNTDIDDAIDALETLVTTINNEFANIQANKQSLKGIQDTEKVLTDMAETTGQIDSELSKLEQLSSELDSTSVESTKPAPTTTTPSGQPASGQPASGQTNNV